MSKQLISPVDFQALCASGNAPLLIDVRTEVEFAAVHARGAKNIPLDRIDLKEITSTAQGQTVYVICKAGKRGDKACEKLSASGLANVVNVAGGTDAWLSAGLPVERQEGVMSLERQVRIAAGLLVLTGVALGWFVHRGFFGLSGFVGAGLIFAGLTDCCAMGLMMSRMPWNRMNSCQSSCCNK